MPMPIFLDVAVGPMYAMAIGVPVLIIAVVVIIAALLIRHHRRKKGRK